MYAILVTEIFCCWYSIINNSTKNKIFSRNLVIDSAIYWDKPVEFYANLFRFHIFILQCLGVYFLADTVYSLHNLISQQNAREKIFCKESAKLLNAAIYFDKSCRLRFLKQYIQTILVYSLEWQHDKYVLVNIWPIFDRKKQLCPKHSLIL